MELVEEGCQPEEGRAQRPQGRQDCKNEAGREKESQSTKKAGKSTRTKQASTPRAEIQGAKILVMIGRAKGATLAEIMKATDWQAHSVRGFRSTAAKKHKLDIESSKNESGERVYNNTRISPASFSSPPWKADSESTITMGFGSQIRTKFKTRGESGCGAPGNASYSHAIPCRVR
jgi:hypothetical protein